MGEEGVAPPFAELVKNRLEEGWREYLEKNSDPGGLLTEQPSRVTAEQHYWKIHEEIRELHKAKGADYGAEGDPFANLRASAEFGVPAWVGVVIRMNDKISRIKSFVKKGKLVNESIEDSLLDNAHYSMLALALYREEKQDGRRTDEGP